METEHVGVCVIILNEPKTRVLLGKRLNHFRAGMLGLPGGKIDKGEPIEACGKRELEEETSLIGNKFEFVGVIREQQKEVGFFIHFAFVCSDFIGEPKRTEPDKCAGWKWHPLNKLPKNILQGHKAALDIYLHPDKPLFRDLL